jgi:cytochrome P450
VPTAQGRSIGSVIDMQDEIQNTVLKRGVGSAFTTKAVLAYENDVETTARELIEVIKAYPTFDLFQTMQFFQLDFLTKIAFSQSYGHLKERRDIWGMTGPTHQRILHFVKWQALPTLEYYLYRHPLWCRLFKIPQSSNWVAEALSQLNARMKSSKDLPHPTAPSTDLLQKYVEASQKYPEIKTNTLALMTTSTISAGFDTTAQTFTSVLFYLITHPRVLKKLEVELIGEAPSSSLSIPAWESVNKLPYLDAILKESMRCNPFLPAALERVAPPAGTIICDLPIPPGTIIGAIAHVVHHDPHVFGHDVETFRPERWLDATTEQRLAMERGSLGFGSGKRNCLGRHIAELEIKKVVPALIGAFDMVLEHESTSLESTDVANFPAKIMVRFEARKGAE